MSNPHVYVFVHPAYADLICYPQTLNVWEQFELCGATVKYGKDFNGISPQPGDKLVSYGRIDEYADMALRFPAKDRWSYVVDESSSTTGPYDKAMTYMKQFGYTQLIVTYQNSAHLEKLTAHGYKYVIMPQTMPTIRPKVEKTNGVLLSGQVSEGFYPVRTLAWYALESGLREHVTALGTPGQDISTRRHNTIRGAYYDLLDTFKMGVVCRAGHRDRFVAKYIEMGACHMLPIGDCPTYMPAEMKAAMVNIEGMRGEDIVKEVRRLLEDAPDELAERTAAYTAAISVHYMATPNMQRVMNEICAM